jgi:mono/diheme cytochrome c family protein
MRHARLGISLLILSALATAVVAFAATVPAKKPAAAPAKSTSSASAKEAKIAKGKKLVMTSGCQDCHTPGYLWGTPDWSRELAGSELGWSGPWGTTYARNLTPDPETGLGYYKEEEIVRAFRAGKRLDGQPMMPPMPWQDYNAFTDDELGAIAAYLLSLRPITHQVPDRLPPGQAPTGSFLTLPAPSAWDTPTEADTNYRKGPVPTKIKP